MQLLSTSQTSLKTDSRPAAIQVCLESDINELLVQLYQYTTKNSQDLLLFLQALLQAERIEKLKLNHQDQLYPSLKLSSFASNLQAPTKRFIKDNASAYLAYYSDTQYSFVIRLRYKNACECREKLTSDKVSALASHIQQVLAMQQKLVQQEGDLNAIENLLSALPLPVCVFDDKLNCLFYNLAFNNHFSEEIKALPPTSQAREQKDLLTICQNSEERSALKQAISNLASNRHGDSKLMHLDIAGKPCTIVLSTSGEVENIFRHYARKNTVWVHVLSSDHSQQLRTSKHFNDLGLSKAESELCCALFSGHSLDEICQERRVSKQTVRKQLQSTLKKTHLDSQEALIIFLFKISMQTELMT